MSELDNLFNQYVSGGKAENKPTRAEFKPLILDDDTQDIDANKKDQQTIPQYVDIDKVPEQQFVQPERRSYFVAGNVNNNEINTTAQKPNEIEYEANVFDDEKKKDDYFALTKLSTSKKNIVKNAIKYITGAANPIQSAINTVGAFTGKDDKEIVLEGVRGFTGSTIDFASSLYRFFKQNADIAKTYTKEQLDKIANLGNVMTGGESFADDIAQQYTEFYKQIDEENKILKDKTERFLQYTGIAKTDKDGFIYDLVGGGASLMYAIGIAAITKSPAAAAEMFGMYQYQSLYEEGIDRGFSPIKARTIGVAGGAFEGGLEMVGLHVLVETLKARRSFTKILKAALTEFTQEASQQGAEEVLSKLSGLREDSTVGQIISNVFYAGVIGAILGGGSATVSNVFYKQISDSATRELINNGMQSEYAKQMVDNVLKLSVDIKTAKEIAQIMKDEQSPVTYKNADPRETYKETGEAIKKALDPEQKRGVELEFIDEKKKFVDSVANALINSGRFTQEEAYKQAEAQANLADGLARIGFEQDNIRPSEYYKRFKVDVTSGNIETDERNIDEENPFVDVSFDPVDFDDEARAAYEAEQDAIQDQMDSLQEENKTTLKQEARILGDMGIGAIRKPTADGYGKERWAEYKDLSPRIKRYFFSDNETAMKWDEAEDLLGKDLFEYLTGIDRRAATLNQPEVFNRVLAKEKEDIKQKAIADGTFMKAPNGKDSNLPEQLWLIVRTKAFKSWFGDWLNDPANASKVVDENGEPLVVYHGTNAKFSVFDKNRSYQGLFWFSNDYNKVNVGYDGANGSGVIMPVFLNIKNPAGWDLYEKYSAEEIENMKYDGLLLKDGNETVAVAFDNKQIKSINNSGKFDRNNPDIYRQGYNPNANSLIMTTAVKANHLNDILKTNTLVAPSFAITQKGQQELQKGEFGELLFIRKPETINYKKDNIYNGDIYSPRFPSPVYKLNGQYYYSPNERNNDNPNEKVGDNPNTEKYLFLGFNERTGERIYKKYTAKNLLAELKKERLLRGERFFDSTFSSFLAGLRVNLTSKEILKQEAADKLKDRKTAQEQYDKLEKEFEELNKELKAYYKYEEFEEDYVDFLLSVANDNIDAAKDYVKVYDIPKSLIKKTKSFIKKAQELPVSYFEAKPMREIALNQFKKVLAPQGVLNNEQREKLQQQGIEVVEYEKGSLDQAIKDLENDRSVYFQAAYLQEEQYFANMIHKYNPNIPKDDLYDDAKGVQLTFNFEQQANRETIESDVDKNVTDDVTQQETLTTIGNGASYAIWRNGKTGNRLDKLDSISDIRRIKDSFVGLSITETLIHNGQFSLEGKIVHNPYELAVAAQVLRNPRFETIHAVFVKNDEIVYHFAATTRLAGATQFDIKGMDDLISKTDCDGFYLIHNHPNGDPKPSFADTIFTQRLAERYGSKFKQHVVIDHNRYRTIDKDGVMSDTDLIIDSTKRDNLLKTSKKHKGLYKKIDPETLPMFAVDLQYGDGKSVVVYVTNKLQAKAIQVVDNSIFDDIDTALEYLSKSGDYAGSGRMFVITDSADVNKQAKFIRKEYTREDKLAGILDVVYSKTKLNKDMVDNKQYETAYDIDRGYFSGRYNNKFFGERKYLYSGRLQNKKSLLKPTFDRDTLIGDMSSEILSINPHISYSSLRKLVVAIENLINEKNDKAKDIYRKEINSIYKKENIDKNKTDKLIDRYTELFQQLKQGVVLREDATNYFQDNENPRGATTVFDRQYFINLFSTADKSTLMHEMAHAWLSEINYFAKAKNATQKVLDLKKQLDNWLGEPEDNGRYSIEQQEKFAQNFEIYLKEGKAPTAKLKTVFARFKTWLSEIYDRIKDDLPKLSDDVRELFDNILSRSYDVPDSNIYAGKEKAIKEVIKNIQEGRASEVDGITIDDVYNLLNMAYTRKPNRPSKNLKQLLNDKNIYDFNELNKAGADTVLQILKDGGYVKEDVAAETAMDLARKALDGEPVYRLADQWRVAGDIDFARNLRVLEKVIEFSQIDSTLEKILELQQEGYRNVEQSDIDKVQSEYERLKDADLKEAKKIVEDIINRLHKKRFIDRAAQKQMIADLNLSSTAEEIRESVLNTIEDLQDEIKLVKEQLRSPRRKPIVRKDKTIPPAKDATEEEKNTYKKYMRKQIDRLLKQALPRKQNQQKFSKFDVETQRFFTDLENYNKMTIEAAQEELYKRATSIIDEEGEGLNNFEKMKNMFLSYKANKINQNSTEFYKQLYDNLQEINVFGRNAKDIENTLKKEKIQKDINDLVVNIEENKSKNGLATGLKKQYVKWLGNWWSTINAIAGKKQADKDSLERIEIDIFNKDYSTTENLKTKSAAALGLKNATDLDMTVNRYLNEEYTYNEKDPRSNTENAVKLNKMQLICCYIWMKNSTLRDRIVRAYGNTQIMDMMEKLTIQDKKFGDELQKAVADLYDDVNAVYLKMYGLDMPQAENYFPSSVERIQGNMDLLKDNIGQVSSPGFIKARVQSNLPLMNFGNPVKIALDHITKVNHFVYMQEKLADLNKVYKTTIVKRHITNLYGDNVYRYILQVLDNAKFTTVARTIDGISDVGDYLVNNYVLTKIAIKPSIMIKQLLSCINYAEDMSSVQWFSGFLKGVHHYKKTIDFMMTNSKYCQSRFAKGGQTEALLKAMEGRNATFAKVKTFKGMLSWMTRVGDIGAIIFGGYPLVMDQMSKGVPLEKAIEKFEQATVRSQQASLPSTLSNWQYRGMNSWLYRAMFAFANTPNQYCRKMGDSMYMYFHGDIDKKQLAKSLMIYGCLNSLLYTSFTSLAILSGLVSGNWDDLKDDIIMSLLQTSNVLALPIVSQAYNSFVSRVVTGKFTPDKEIPLLDDMIKIMRTATKEDLEFNDYLNIVDEVGSLVLGVPVKTLYNGFVGSTKDLLDGEYGKFAVKLYGATESRANKIFD